MTISAEAAVTVGCLQFEPRVGEAADNRAAGAAMIEEAAGMGARLIVLPELSDFRVCLRVPRGGLFPVGRGA